MMQLLGISSLFELFFRILVLLYFPALLCLLIGYRFMRDCFDVLVNRRDMPASDRHQLARYMACQGLQGFIAGVVIFFLIYFRKELYLCVTGLF